MIQIPDTSKKQRAMISIKGLWYAIYSEDGKQRRKALGTSNIKHAVKRRDLVFTELLKKGATLYQGRTPQDKVIDKPYLYIYSRPPFQFKVKGKILFESWSEAEVRAARDAWLEEN